MIFFISPEFHYWEDYIFTADLSGVHFTPTIVLIASVDDLSQKKPQDQLFFNVIYCALKKHALILLYKLLLMGKFKTRLKTSFQTIHLWIKSNSSYIYVSKVVD